MFAELKIVFVVLVLLPASFAYFSTKKEGDVAREFKRRVDAEHPECLAQSGLNAKVADEFWDTLVYPEGRPFKCYMECLYKAFNALKPDGTMDVDYLIKNFELMTQEGFDACSEKIKVGADGCEKAFNFDTCILNFYM